MSYSWSTFDKVIRHVLQVLQPGHVLDIGAGRGKYGRMIRAAGLDHTRMTAVECDPDRHAELTQAGYHEILSIPAQQLLDTPAREYDFVILGDVIEHMKHSDGQDLLEFLNYRCRYMLIVTPECMPMSDSTFFVGHNSLWTPRAMQWHDLWAHQRCRMMHLYLLRGYLDYNAKSLGDVVASVNAQEFMLLLDDAQPDSPLTRCQMSIVDHRVTDPVPNQPGVLHLYRPG